MFLRTASVIGLLLLAGGGATQSAKIELKATEWGSLEGTVTYDGEPPVPIDRRKEISGTMELHCLKGPPEELLDPTWKVNKKNKGVANVVVYLEPPLGKYFALEDKDKTRSDTVVLDLPFCAFRPHVLALMTAYHDGEKRKETGQRFKVRNSSTTSQSIRWTVNPVVNPDGGGVFRSETELSLQLWPQREPVKFNLDWNRWMHAYVWVLPHPYIAISDENGRFRIPRVPAAVELHVFAWHEAKGNFYGGKTGVRRQFDKGVNTLSLTLSAP